MIVNTDQPTCLRIILIIASYDEVVSNMRLNNIGPKRLSTAKKFL